MKSASACSSSAWPAARPGQPGYRSPGRGDRQQIAQCVGELDQVARGAVAVIERHHLAAWSGGVPDKVGGGRVEERAPFVLVQHDWTVIKAEPACPRVADASTQRVQ